MNHEKNYQVTSSASLELKMSRWKDYSVTLNDGTQFNVAVFGKQKEFKSFCNRCKVCKEPCDKSNFIKCINTKKEEDLMVFTNRKEAQEFFQLMLFL